MKKKNAWKIWISVLENEICIVCVVLNIPWVSAEKDLNNMEIYQREIYLYPTAGPISSVHLSLGILDKRIDREGSMYENSI